MTDLLADLHGAADRPEHVLRPPFTARAANDCELGETIKSIHAAIYGVYGARRIDKELGRQDVAVARRNRKAADGSGQVRRFQPAAPNRLWVADDTLTYWFRT